MFMGERIRCTTARLLKIKSTCGVKLSHRKYDKRSMKSKMASFQSTKSNKILGRSRSPNEKCLPMTSDIIIIIPFISLGHPV